MAYRESFESCPRCAVALEDAGDVRACRACRGQWVLETVLAEMVMEMVPAGLFGRLTLTPVERDGEATACPACGVKLEPVNMYGVDVERCPKQHGVWFDPEELQMGLRHAANPRWHSERPDVSHLPRYERRPPPPPPSRPAPPVEPGPPSPPAPLQPDELALEITTPGDVYREARLRQQAIKIGRHARCHVQVNDPRVANAHVLIEMMEDGPVLIDLGAAEGTLVNGKRVTKQTLASGDQIVIGATTITVRFSR